MLSINQLSDSTSKISNKSYKKPKTITKSAEQLSKYDSGMNRSMESMHHSSNLSGPSS